MTDEELERLRMREANLWRRFVADTTSQARGEWRKAREEYEAALRLRQRKGKNGWR